MSSGVSAGTVLILGATSDIARAVARRYGEQGRALVLAARDVGRVEADAADLRVRYGVEVAIRRLDGGDPGGALGLADGLPCLPDTVVCAIGLLGDQQAAEQDAGLAEVIWRTNFIYPAALLGEFANRMAGRGSGVIIGISSVAGERGRASNYFYGSAKAGFTAFLSGLRNRLARRGVRVITVKPGFVRTRMTEGLKLPAVLTAEPDEVACAILRAEASGRDVVYVRPVWWLIMAVIRFLPEALFKRLSL
jgi:hypothetical protein